MKILYTFILALITLNAVNAQLPLKENWSRALLTTGIEANALGTDTIQKSITVVQADSLIRANDSNENFQIIDVRTHDEFILGHLPNAENIDIYDSTFNAQIGALDRDKIYLVYCYAGSRSSQAFSYMVLMNFREVYNMTGGFKKWKSDGYPYDVDTNTSINYLHNTIADIRLYPNPAAEKLIVEVTQPLNSGTIFIYNSQGQEQISRLMLQEKEEIDIGSLPSGVYLLRLSSQDKFIQTKFIRQ